MNYQLMGPPPPPPAPRPVLRSVFEVLVGRCFVFFRVRGRISEVMVMVERGVERCDKKA